MATVPTFSPEEINTAQWMADSLNVVSNILFIGVGMLLPVVMVCRGRSLGLTWFISAFGMVSACLIADLLIQMLLHHYRPRIGGQISGDYGEQPTTVAGMCMASWWSPLVYGIGTLCRRSVGKKPPSSSVA